MRAGFGAAAFAATLAATAYTSAFLTFAAPATAQTQVTAIPDPATLEIAPADVAAMREWVQVPLTVDTLRGLNAEQATLSQADIDALDAAWRAESKTVGDRPLVAQLLARPLSSYLIRRQASSNGLYSEIFVMTDRGLNAGQSSVTSDYWQGDEAKFSETFEVGPDAVFVDDPEYHEESGTWRRQVNFTVVDPDSGKPIGAITVEINLTELARRRAYGS